MATTRIIPMHIGKGRTVRRAMEDIIGYSENPDKTDGGEFITSYACDAKTADAEFLLSKREYIAKTGRTRGKDDVIAYQLRQSFVPGEITPEKANRIGCELAQRFTKGNHAYIVCTHVDKAHFHNHIIWSAVNLDCDRKFRNFWGSAEAVRRLSDTICIENGFSIVENPKAHGKSYNKWLGSRASMPHREQLRMLIGICLKFKPKNLEELFDEIEERGIRVIPGKPIKLQASEWKRPVRLDSLGDDYTEEALRAIISGQKTRDARKKSPNDWRPEKMNLLVDVQAKLQAGKGAGYERWAKIFNLKQMAKTMMYLSEHGFEEYAEVAEKTEAVTARYHELSEKIKTSESRLTEISTLQKHIVNYAKTREVYVEYRKAGYSKKFLAEHEQDILLHKATKHAFNDLGIRKLPSIKSLKKEYQQILAEKRECYGEYSNVRKEMKELQIVKANLDRMLEQDKQDTGKEKDHGQR